MNLIEGLLSRTTSLLLWGIVCLLFSFFLAQGNVIFSAIIASAVLYLWLFLQGSKILSYIWLLGPPTFFIFIDMVLHNIPGITMERVMIATLGVKLCLDLVFNNSSQHRLTLLEGLMIVFCVYALISLIINTTEVSLVDDLWLLLQYAMAMASFVIGSRINLKETDVRRLLALLSLVGVYLAILGVLQTLNMDIFGNVAQDLTAGHEGRALGPFNSAHTYSATLLIICVLTLWQYTFYRDPMIRTILIGMMFAMAIGIVLGQTRAPWLGFAIVLLIIFIKDIKVRPLLTIGAMVCIPIGLTIVIMMSDELVLFIKRALTISTMADRFVIWATAINMIIHNPIFGVGFTYDSFVSHKREYITSIGSLPEQFGVFLNIPHNELLYVTVMLGIVGLILFVLIVYKMLRLMFSIYSDELNTPMCRQLGLYIGAIIIGLIVNSMFSDTMLQQYFWTITYFLAGIVSGLAIRSRRPPSVADIMDNQRLALSR
jgi:O-antigen ligase